MKIPIIRYVYEYDYQHITCRMLYVTRKNKFFAKTFFKTKRIIKILVFGAHPEGLPRITIVADYKA